MVGRMSHAEEAGNAFRPFEGVHMNENLQRDAARKDQLILVDALDRQVDIATKERAHREGLLHRAFSVVLVRQPGNDSVDWDRPAEVEFLLTKRAACKYHSGGLWTNSCCSHPRAGETLEEAVPRRVREELGAGIAHVREIDSFMYRAPFPDGLCEYEYDHVFLAECVGSLAPDPAEVDEMCWVASGDLAAELTDHPERFTAWAYTVLAKALAHVERTLQRMP